MTVTHAIRLVIVFATGFAVVALVGEWWPLFWVGAIFGALVELSIEWEFDRR